MNASRCKLAAVALALILASGAFAVVDFPGGTAIGCAPQTSTNSTSDYIQINVGGLPLGAAAVAIAADVTINGLPVHIERILRTNGQTSVGFMYAVASCDLVKIPTKARVTELFRAW